MVVKQAQLDSVKGNFVLEKDTAYQEAVSYTRLMAALGYAVA